MYIKDRKKDSTRHTTVTLRASCLALLKANGENVNQLTNELLHDYCKRLQHGSITHAHAESRRSKWRETQPSIKVNLRLRSDLVDYLKINDFSVGGVVRRQLLEYCDAITTLTDGDGGGDGAAPEAAERSEAWNCRECRHLSDEDGQCEHPDAPPCDADKADRPADRPAGQTQYESRRWGVAQFVRATKQTANTKCRHCILQRSPEDCDSAPCKPSEREDGQDGYYTIQQMPGR